jgi:hypothetical protein
MGLQKGLYGARLTATNQFGMFSTDTVWVAVDTAISFSTNTKHFSRQQLMFGIQASCIFENKLLCIGEADVAKNKWMF